MYLLNEEQKKNLLILLNRVQYKGLEEVEAVNNILVSLSKKVETQQTCENNQEETE